MSPVGECGGLAGRREIWVIVVISIYVALIAILYTEQWILDPTLHVVGESGRRRKVQQHTTISTCESRSILYTGTSTEGYDTVGDNVHQWLTGSGVREIHVAFVVINIDSG